MSKRLNCFLLPLTAALANATGAAAQILPPVVEQPTEILQPPVVYPQTTATSAAGPYLAIPAWDQKLAPNVRFVVLTNLNSDAVLDRETGLVWARRPILSAASADPEMPWVAAAFGCTGLTVGGRGGWRLPRADELQSLVDFALPEAPNALRLPAGHPFMLHAPSVEYYWSGEYLTPVDEAAWIVSLISGLPTLTSPQIATNHAAALCVRGARA
ncbi:MAG TPA: DUF1566 domain-containing protein [Steroidobacteraceae bacterium]|nr:DUF1566 domain-containing protein [Steroidobacteraceae bacterium]